MLAFLSNIGPIELVLIAFVAVLVFGKDLPQAASKAYMQVRKLRNAVDDLRRDSGIDREIRDIERTVREAEWEARKMETRSAPAQAVPRAVLPEAPRPSESVTPPASEPTPPAAKQEGEPTGGPPTPAG